MIKLQIVPWGACSYPQTLVIINVDILVADVLENLSKLSSTLNSNHDKQNSVSMSYATNEPIISLDSLEISIPQRMRDLQHLDDKLRILKTSWVHFATNLMISIIHIFLNGTPWLSLGTPFPLKVLSYPVLAHLWNGY